MEKKTNSRGQPGALGNVLVPRLQSGNETIAKMAAVGEDPREDPTATVVSEPDETTATAVQYCTLTDEEYQTVCSLAAEGKLQQMKEFVEKVCSRQGHLLGHETFWQEGEASPLVLAAQYGHLGVVEYLLNVDPLYTNEFINQTATISFAEGAQEIHHCTGLNAASISGHLSIVEKLLLSGASVNIPDCLEATSFCEATFHGHLDIMKALASHGADINTPNMFGWSPLDVAVSKGRIHIVRYLLESGADTLHTTPEGHTAMHIAAGMGELLMVKELLKHGVPPLFATAPPLSESYTPCPLYLAAANGFTSIVKQFTRHPDCPPACESDAWLLIGVNILERGGSYNQYAKYWEMGLALRGEKNISPLYLPPVDAYWNRVEMRSLKSLQNANYLLQNDDKDLEMHYQALIVRERCMGPGDPQMFQNLTNTAKKVINRQKYSEAEPLWLRAIELAEKVKLTALEKGLPQTLEMEFGRWLEEYLAGWLIILVQKGYTPDFGRCVHFAWKLLNALQSRVQVLHLQYGCERKDPQYLLENLLLLFHVWLYHNSEATAGQFRSEQQVDASVRHCEELGRGFVGKHLHLQDRSALLHLALQSQKTLYMFLLTSPLIKQELRHFARLCNEPLLVDALLRWGAAEVVNLPCGAEGDRPLHLAVRKTSVYREKGVCEAMLSVLLSHGAHPDAVNHRGLTPAMIRQSRGDSTGEIAALLAPPTPLPLACQASITVLRLGIPYSILPYIPPRLKQFIQFHDKTKV